MNDRLPSKTTVTIVVFASLIFCFGIITKVVLDGDPDNSNHASALAWSFSLLIAIVVGLIGERAVGALAVFRGSVK